MKHTIYIFTILLILTGCKDHDWMDAEEANAGDIINVGGVATSPLDITVSETASRAKHVQDAEEIPWLIKPLKAGLDITYGKVSNDQSLRQTSVAILKLTGGTPTDNVYETDPVTQWAIYSFKYKSDNKDAIWYDNGEHFFEGMFVPDNLRYGTGVSGTGRTELSSVNTTSAPNITTDQSNATNYSYLEHYLAMPANTTIHATVGRVKLPFYHRLSRVIAYILIDPEMQTDPLHPVTLRGYKSDVMKDAEGNPVKDKDGNDVMYEDPTTTSLRFCNVEVLTGVKDVPPTGTNLTDELTPQWGTTEGIPQSIRKVIPHFEAEEGSMIQNATGDFTEKDENFYMFYDDKTQEYIFPTMEKWIDYYNEYKNATEDQLKAAKVTRTNYGKVPVYDLIVRPTYTAENSVMYDEDLSSTTKTALVTKKNKIDFELILSNGLIYTKEFEFDLNANEQTVVYLRISRESVDYNASGSDIWVKRDNNDDWYGVDNRGEHSLSGAGSTWQRAYTYSTTVSDDKVTDGGFYNEKTTGEDGTVGQYVTKETWIKKFSQAHEDGECHGDYFMLTSDITISAKDLPDNFVFTGHLDAHGKTITITETGQQWTEYVATTDYSIDPLYSNQSGTVYNLPTLYIKVHHDAVKYKQEEIDAAKAIVEADGYVQGTNPEAEEIADKTTDDIKTEAYDTYNVVTPTLAEAMNAAAGTYYEKVGTEYLDFYYRKPSVLYTAVPHTSGSALFAGLNGAYAVTQEGEANVHTENGVKVPYTDGNTGWRAEVMNLVVSGKLFADDVYTPNATARTGYDVTKVSGNVQNCYDTQGKVPNHTPALFQY